MEQFTQLGPVAVLCGAGVSNGQTRSQKTQALGHFRLDLKWLCTQSGEPVSPHFIAPGPVRPLSAAASVRSIILDPFNSKTAEGKTLQSCLRWTLYALRPCTNQWVLRPTISQRVLRLR